MKEVKVSDSVNEYIIVGNVEDLFDDPVVGPYVGAEIAGGYRGMLTINDDKELMFTSPPETDKFVYMGERIFLFDSSEELFDWVLCREERTN